jgi:uncharacterized protein YdeI (YjbR/CyaY-like superfamily)
VNPEVDAYLRRAKQWSEEMAALRPVLLGGGLAEEIKWGKPCYGHAGKNIVILQPMKEFLSLMFFKGALLPDPEGVLEDQGPNSRAARRMRFTSVEEVARQADTVAAYVAQAIAVEAAGLELAPAPELVLADALQERLDRDPALEAAFSSLTPGRQREYNLYFSAAKKADTRRARVDKYTQKILDGEGLSDR